MSVDWTRVDALERTNIGAHWPQADVAEHLRIRERVAEVARYSPALPAAWTLLEVGRQAVWLLDRDLAATGEGITDRELLLDVLGERPAAAVGLVTGSRGPAWTLVAVRVASFGAWSTWLDSVAVLTVEVPDGAGGMTVRHTSRPGIGTPGQVLWRAPDYPTGRISGVLRNQENEGAGQLAREWSGQGDGGGYALFPALPDQAGRLPRFKFRTLADGVEVLGDGASVPVWARKDGRTATLLSIPVDPTLDEASEPWFCACLGGRY